MSPILLMLNGEPGHLGLNVKPLVRSIDTEDALVIISQRENHLAKVPIKKMQHVLVEDV